MFRPVNIRHYVSFMEARGYHAEDVLSDSGMSAAQLKDPACLFDFTQYQTVVKNLIRLTGNQAIGFEIGRESELSDFGLVGYAMMSSRTARDALGLWRSYSNSVAGMMISLELDEFPDGTWALTISDRLPMGFVFNFGVEEILMIAIKSGEALTKVPFVAESIELSFPAPAHQDLYERYLNCRPQFNCRQSRIRFASPTLATPVRGFNEELHLLCLQHCRQVMREIASGSAMEARIRSLLLGRVNVIPHVDEVAARLNMSPRTLRRRLQDEGVTYKSIVHNLRVDLAREYLQSSRMTTKETAHLLGFRDVNAFRRAFKLWTGLTISEFRDEAEPTS